jgi:hypothetical protein
MKNPLVRKTPIERLEADLAKLHEQRERLVDRLATAQGELDRSRLLVSTLAPQEEADSRLSAAEAAVRNQLDRCGSLSGAISSLDTEVAGAERALADERDRVARKVSIETLQKLSADFDAPLAKLTEALDELGVTAVEATKYTTVGQNLPSAWRTVALSVAAGAEELRASLAHRIAKIARGEGEATLVPLITRAGRVAPVPRPEPPKPGPVYDPLRPTYRPPPGIDPMLRS